MTAYGLASDAVFDVFRDITPLVEPISVDEAFLDVTGLRRLSGEPLQIGRRCASRCARAGGAADHRGDRPHQVPGEVASQVAKPDGLLLVPPDRELAFLHPLAVRRLWGWGPRPPRNSRRTASRPSRRWPSSASRRWRPWSAGRWARSCSRYPATSTAAGQHDPHRRSVGAQRALGGRRYPPTELDAVVIGLIDRITRRMRGQPHRPRWCCDSGSTTSPGSPARNTLPGATASTAPLLAAARTWWRRPLR